MTDEYNIRVVYGKVGNRKHYPCDTGDSDLSSLPKAKLIAKELNDDLSNREEDKFFAVFNKNGCPIWSPLSDKQSE